MVKIVDFESRRPQNLFKKKEAKVDALRKAFRQARGESDSDSTRGKRKKRNDLKKNR